jgi:hypothetical protein
MNSLLCFVAITRFTTQLRVNLSVVLGAWSYLTRPAIGAAGGRKSIEVLALFLLYPTLSKGILRKT